jgi:hypothetical protein
MLFNPYNSYLIYKNEYLYKNEECLHKKEKEKGDNPKKQKKKNNPSLFCRIHSSPNRRFHRVHFPFLLLRFVPLHEALLPELENLIPQPH